MIIQDMIWIELKWVRIERSIKIMSSSKFVREPRTRYEYIWTYMKLYEIIWICMKLHELIWTCAYLYEIRSKLIKSRWLNEINQCLRNIRCQIQLLSTVFFFISMILWSAIYTYIYLDWNHDIYSIKDRNLMVQWQHKGLWSLWSRSEFWWD
jgi:hypothetical protein